MKSGAKARSSSRCIEEAEGGLLFATPATLLVVCYLFAMLRKRNDGKPAHGLFEEGLP